MATKKADGMEQILLRLESIDKRLEKIEQRQDKMEEMMTQLIHIVAETNARVTRMEVKFDQRMDMLEQRMDKLEQRQDKMEEMMTQLIQVVVDTNARVTRIEEKVELWQEEIKQLRIDHKTLAVKQAAQDHIHDMLMRKYFEQDYEINQLKRQTVA